MWGLVGLALLPSIIIIAVVSISARRRNKTFGKKMKVFGISAASTILALILETAGTVVLGVIAALEKTDLNTPVLLFFNCFLVIAASEEGCKLFTYKLMIFNDRQFENTYDGVIYGAMSALGFATLENLMYVLFSGEGEGLKTALLRAVLSVPVHASTGILMGYWYGIVKYRKYNGIKAGCPHIIAYIVSVLLHGAFDFVLMYDATLGDGENDFNSVPLMIVVGVITLCAYIILISTIVIARKRDMGIYNEYYYTHLNGSFQDTIGETSSSNLYKADFSSFNYINVNSTDNAQYWQNSPAPKETRYPNAQLAGGSDKFCTACGAKVDGADRFCNVCGHRLG